VDAPIPPVVARLRAAGCVFAEDEARLLVEAADTAAELDAMLTRRTGGDPLEYVLGWAEFCRLRIAVEPGVFVPRRRTEFLVAQAIGLAPSDAVVLDVCCGSGAIGAAIAAALPDTELHATDVDPIAVRCARRNLDGSARIYQGDMYEPLPGSLRGRVDVLVANVPYVPTEAVALMPPEAREHERRAALDGGPDGLDLARRLFAGAPQWLAPGGCALVESTDAQADALVDVVVAAGLDAAVASSSDELDATVVLGRYVMTEEPGPPVARHT
jgi:release factor glutamine methyltransferase